VKERWTNASGLSGLSTARNAITSTLSAGSGETVGQRKEGAPAVLAAHQGFGVAHRKLKEPVVKGITTKKDPGYLPRQGTGISTTHTN
jgi:hypothetical protein